MASGAASKAFLNAVRDEFPDPSDKPFDEEGFPADIEKQIRKQRSISFSLGSSSFVLRWQGTAEVRLPPTIRPASWKYLEMFLDFIGDMPFVTAITIIVPETAVEAEQYFDVTKYPTVPGLISRTRALIRTLNEERKAPNNAPFITVQGQGPKLAHPFLSQEPSSPPAIMLSAAGEQVDKQRRARSNLAVLEAGGAGKPVELWFITTRSYESKEQKAIGMSKPCSYGYTPIKNAKDAVFGQIDYRNQLIVHVGTQSAWLENILNNKLPIVVYIHGYANTLETAIDSAEKLWTEIAALQTTKVNVILFAWPSRGGRLGPISYGSDLDRIGLDVNVAVFRDLLSSLAPVADRTVLLAHSMGNILLMSTLAEMSLSAVSAFKAVFSVAPAVVAQYWAEYAFAYFKATRRQVFLCCSPADWALYAMEIIERDPAVGLLTGMPVCSPVHHTIEVPHAIAKSLDGKGHSYFTTPAMVKLIMAVILSDSKAPLENYELSDPSKTKKTSSWHILRDLQTWRPTQAMVPIATIPNEEAKAAAMPAPKPKGSPSVPAANVTLADVLKSLSLDHLITEFADEEIDMTNIKLTADSTLALMGLSEEQIKALRDKLSTL